MPALPICHVVSAGVVEYMQAWELQKTLSQEVAEGHQPNTLLLLEHPPVYTIGRRGTRDQVRLDDEQLTELGIPLHETDRGGQVTFHGPGQLVAYPVIDLRDWGGPVKYVRTLEHVIIKCLADFGIAAGLIDGQTGVWACPEHSQRMGSENAGLEPSRKIAAIGVRISRGVSHHGLALNVNTDLTLFKHIIPCGITDLEVTSVERLLGRPVDMDTVAYSLTYHFGREMGFHMVELEASPERLAAGQPSAVGN